MIEWLNTLSPFNARRVALLFCALFWLVIGTAAAFIFN